MAFEALLYGRASEQAMLDQMLADARDARSRVLVIRGLAGIGKTALLHYTAEEARGTGMRVLRCMGVESEIELAFAGLHQLVRPLIDRIDNLPPAQAAALRGAVGLDESAGDRFLVATGLLTLLADTAEEQPLLVVIDDAHWLDTPSAEALAFAARRLEAEPIAVLFAVREGAERPFYPAGLPVIELQGLEPGPAAQLLDAQGRRLAPEVRARLLAESEGNPLALIELSSSLSSSAFADTEPLPLSSRLQQGYLERVFRLPEETQRLLVLAAAEDDLQVVLAAGARLGIAEEALWPAEREGLVQVDDSQVRFRHPLIRSAIYQGAMFYDRLEAHRLLARVLAGSEQDDRHVWHLAAGTLGYDEQVAAALERIGEGAERRRGPGAAATALERAALLTSEPGERARRLMRAAWGAFNAGQWDRAHQLLDQAAPLAADPPVLADIALIKGLLQFQTASIDAAFTTLISGAEQARQLDPERAASMLAVAGRMAWLTADLPRLQEIEGHVMALPGPDDSLFKRLALNMLGPLLAEEHRPHGGFVVAASEGLGSLEPSHRSADYVSWLWPPVYLVTAVGDERAVYPLYKRGIARLRGAGLIGQLAQALASLCFAEVLIGRWDSAQVDATEGLQLSRDTEQTAVTGMFLADLASIAGSQGRADECRRFAGEALATAGAQDRGAIAVTRWALGRLELGAGRYEDAYEHLSRIARPERWPDDSLFAPIAAFDLLEAAVLTHREDTAWRVLQAFERWTEPYSPPSARLIIHRTRAMLASDAEAEAHFEAALAAGSTWGFLVARTHLTYGEWLRRRRRRAEARDQLRAALETFNDLSARPWMERARAELRATGETIPSRGPDAVEQLTPQELQIARLAARGLSNREIGAQLFLSPRTVSFHLYKVFPKLGIASRAELRRLRLETEPAS